MRENATFQQRPHGVYDGRGAFIQPPLRAHLSRCQNCSVEVGKWDLPIKVAEIHVAVCNAILGGQYLANRVS